MTPSEFCKKWSVNITMLKDMNAVIASAVLAERERCAKVAENEAANWIGGGHKGIPHRIAAAIRALK